MDVPNDSKALRIGRLIQLLDQIRDGSEQFVAEIGKEKRIQLPCNSIRREGICEAAQFLHELELSPTANRLTTDFDAWFGSYSDASLCEMARGQSLEYQGQLEEKYGRYPRPEGDEPTEVERDRWIALAGGASMLAEQVRSLIKTLAKQKGDHDGYVSKADLDAVVGRFVEFKTIQNLFKPKATGTGSNNRSMYLYSEIRKVYLEHDDKLDLPKTYSEFCRLLPSVQSGQ